MDEALEKHDQYLPRNTLVTALARCENVTSVSEWIDSIGPINLKLEGGRSMAQV